MPTMPVDRLSEKEQAVWQRLAPFAVEARTLVDRMVDAFVLICKLTVLYDEMQAKLLEDGLTYLKVTVDGAGKQHDELKAHPLISQQRNTAQRLEALLARFGLAPFGKPLDDGGKKKRSTSVWSAVGVPR